MAYVLGVSYYQYHFTNLQLHLLTLYHKQHYDCHILFIPYCCSVCLPIISISSLTVCA